MKLFQRGFFKSKDDSTESLYEKGVRHLKANDFGAADTSLRAAAENGHVSALYNLFLLNGSGLISPYDFDFAATCLYESAKGEHPTAKENLFMLEAADRAGFGMDNLVGLVANMPPVAGLSAILMVCAARFFHAVSEAHVATADVIAYELRGASSSDDRGVLQFIDRTRVPDGFYKRACQSWSQAEQPIKSSMVSTVCHRRSAQPAMVSLHAGLPDAALLAT